MKYDVKKIPFSYPGSYLTFQSLEETQEEKAGLYIKTLHSDVWKDRVVLIEPILGTKEDTDIISADAVQLTVGWNQGLVSFCFFAEDTIYFKSEGNGFQMHYIKASQAVKREQIWEICACAQNTRLLLQMIEGDVEIQSEWDGDNAVSVDAIIASGYAEGMIRFDRDAGIVTRERNIIKYSTALDSTRKKWERWMEKTQRVPIPYQSTYELSQYLNWSSMVSPYQNLLRPTMYASKVSMKGIWSWDHCFHSLGVLRQNPEMAWEQWMLPFDKQTKEGALPDRMDEMSTYWTYTKPPVHGYFILFLMSKGMILSQEKMEYAYEVIKKQTSFWLKYHDSDFDGMAEYDNGNDSGWDNNTAMVKGVPAETPDLATWIYFQAVCLEELVKKLKNDTESKRWRDMQSRLVENLVGHFWLNGRMVGRLSGSHTPVYSDSLLLYIPLLLGERLPREIREKMIAYLKKDGAFLTEHGLATESLKSSWYSSDGYWRGPIWAPSTFFMYEALKVNGELEFAKEIRRRFLNMASDAGSLAENYNALTGEPLRDSAIIWTACVYAYLAEEAGKEDN